ncbi:MAG TPA: ATP-binding protein [Burkholderiaceae bacterium]|jgi:nicotinamide riboside kinase
MSALIVSVLGAESTGKSDLCNALSTQIEAASGLRCVAVPERLRDWCARMGRTPHADEQLEIAEAQIAAIEAAALEADVVLCDTTPLMTAVYSVYLFKDDSLLPMAWAFERRCDLTLLTALDVEWVADGIQRDGPHVRAPVDAATREALIAGAIGWSIVSGLGQARVDAALDAITPLLLKRAAPKPGLFTRLEKQQAAQPEWQKFCDCDSPECEHALLQGMSGHTAN